MRASVIILTRNRAPLLQRALESICRQTLSQEDFEVIVVNNGSMDNTKPIVDRFTKKIKNLRYFYDDVPGLHVGRNRGLKESNSEILVYIDDDSELFPGHLENVLKSFEDEKLVLVGGKNLPRYENEPPQWIVDLWHRGGEEKYIWSLSILDLGEERKEVDPSLVFGCNFSIKKDVLLQTKGFHPDAMPQDLIRYRGDGETYVSQYIKDNHHKALYDPLVSIHHFVSKERMTKEYFYKRNFEKGVSDAYADIRGNKDTGEIDNRLDRLNRQSSEFVRHYVKGYLYLREEVKKDAGLLAWIEKEDYL